MLTSTVSPFASASSSFSKVVFGAPPVRFDSWAVLGEVRVGVCFPFFFLAPAFTGVVFGVVCSSPVFSGGVVSLVEATLGGAATGSAGGAVPFDWRSLQQNTMHSLVWQQTGGGERARVAKKRVCVRLRLQLHEEI